jgi:CheY-like chemotaxis protein
MSAEPVDIQRQLRESEQKYAAIFRYLTKPVKVHELTRALEELLERGPD